MTATVPAPPPAPTTPAAPAGTPGPGPGTWRVTWRGLATVTRLELRQRVRSTRWIVALVVLGAVLLGFAALIHNAAASDVDPWPALFGYDLILVLGIASLVAPALSATSVNGDRTAGVLATLQTTLLSPAEIALGKLLAGWTAGLALLATGLPVLLWPLPPTGEDLGRLVVALLLVAFTLLVECAVALAWSAVATRTSVSAVLTYLSVAFIGLGLPVLFSLSIPLTQTQEVRTVRGLAPVDPATAAQPETYQCTERQELTTRSHPERIWWLLAPHPLVMISDSLPPRREPGGDPLDAISRGMRELREGEPEVTDYCNSSAPVDRYADSERKAPVWPYGLGSLALLGGASLVVTVRRLRAPSRRLPRGARVA